MKNPSQVSICMMELRKYFCQVWCERSLKGDLTKKMLSSRRKSKTFFLSSVKDRVASRIKQEE